MLIGPNHPKDDRPGRTITELDNWLIRVVGRLEGSPALTLAIATYVAIGLVLPLSIGAGRPLFILLNVFGAITGWVLSTAWLLSAVEAGNRRHLLEWTTDLRRLSSTEFEWIVGEVLRREGWNVTETGRDRPDGNIDLRISRGGREMLVQCKRWQSNTVGVDEVRKLAGTLVREELSGQSGVLVTLSRFSESATEEAEQIGIELIDGPELGRRIEQVRASEPCPDCGQPMLLGHSKYGWWLRCPGWPGSCRGKRDLGKEPGRAIRLLLADG